MYGRGVLCLSAIFVAFYIIVVNAAPNNYNRSYYAVNKTNAPHNLITGYRAPGDRLVLRRRVIKAALWDQVVTQQLAFNISKYERLTQVRALDLMSNGYGASARLISGGPGSDRVTLRFTSQKSQPINFDVQLFARPY